jgi:hypothetical protein
LPKFPSKAGNPKSDEHPDLKPILFPTVLEVPKMRSATLGLKLIVHCSLEANATGPGYSKVVELGPNAFFV